MKQTIVLLFLTLFYLSLFAQKELDSYIKAASENNAGLKSTFSDYRAALEMIPQAKALPDPSVMFMYFTTPLLLEMGEQRFNISASQMFPWFGQLKAQEQAAAEMAKAKYAEFINERNKFFYEVKEVYFKLYVHHETLRRMEENIRLLNSMRELARIKFESGMGSFVNVLRSDMEIAEIENELAYHKDLELPLMSEFETLLNTKKYPSLSFPDTLWQDSLYGMKSSVLDSIVKNNPELKKMDYEISYWEKQMEVAKKMGYPSFSLGTSYWNFSKREGNFSGNGRDMVMPEVGITIPLYRKKYNAIMNEAKYKGESAAYEKINMSNELNSEMEMIYRDYLKAQREIVLYTRLFNLAKNAKELLLSAFSAAGTEFEEVLRIQEQELKYGIKLEEARALLNTSVAYINYLSGKQ